MAARSRGAILLLAAFTIWTGDTKLAFTEIFELYQNKLLAVGSLIAAVAQGGSAIEEWMVIRDASAATRQFDA